jgi:FkbM family methyltransferase
MPGRSPSAIVPPITRRFKHSRLVRSGAYQLGEALGDRVFVGKTAGGSPITLSMRDHQHRAIYFYGEYEPEITTLFRRLVKPGSTVFDVGANAGYFSITSRELGAKVHAFEPNPRVRALLARSVELGGGGIEVVAAACSDHNGTMPLYLSDPGNTGMTGLRTPTDVSVDVQVIKLDDYVTRTQARPDLIKLDVEGHEREALAGAQALLHECRPTLIVEASGPATLDLMRTHGYLPQRILPDGSTAAHDGRLDLIGGYENICFVPAPRA